MHYLVSELHFGINVETPNTKINIRISLYSRPPPFASFDHVSDVRMPSSRLTSGPIQISRLFQ